MTPSSGSSFQALVELEKGSPGSPREQLRAAARIIRVDLDCHDGGQNDNVSEVATEQSMSAPKEEWVLRWLLKKLKQSPKGDTGYRIDKYSWVLLRALFQRIPPKALAIILSENKFLSTLTEALDTLGESVASQDNAISQHSRGVSPNTTTANRGRKRKRAEGELASPATTSPWIEILVALLESISQLVSFLSSIPPSQVAARSQLKLVLRGEPGLVARLLGQALHYASNGFAEKKTTPDSTDIQRIIFRAMLSLITVWDSRSDTTVDNGNSSNGAFISHSLTPALQFLQTTSSMELSADKQAIIHGIERLVVLHVILPLRQLFFSLQPTQPSSNDTKGNLGQVETILGQTNAKFSPGTKGELVPILFNIAIRSVPRDTFRRQISEAPWLETLFVCLASRLGYPIFGEVPQEADKEVSLLEELVQVAIDRKVGITLQTLSQYASRYSGLLSESGVFTHWRLVAQTIQINVDLFLPNSGYEESKVFLEKLISRITSEFLRLTPLDPEIQATIKSDVVIPLLRGFSGARDIETSVQIWKDQLASLESGRSSGKDSYYYSVWEDDDVLQVYGDLVTTTFPLGHTKGRLETLCSEIQSAGDVSDSANYTRVVLLDSLLLSKPRQDESFVDSYLFKKLFNVISSLATSKDHPHWHWRLWRILRNLFDKFPASTVRPPPMLASSVLPSAVGSLQTFLRKPNKFDVTGCREAFCSFEFIVHVLTKAYIPDGEGHLNALVASSKSLLPLTVRPANVAWDGRIEILQSPQDVAMGILIILLANPSGVARISSEKRRQFFMAILSALASVPDGQRPQLTEVWDSFVSPDWLLAATPAVYDLVSIICTQLPEDKEMRAFLLGSLLKIPPRSIPSHLRVVLLDSLFDIMVQQQHSPDVELSILALLKCLIELPKSSARIITEWDAMWKIAVSVSPRKSNKPLFIFQAFQKLHKAVVNRIMISSESHRLEYMQRTANKLTSLTKESTTAPDFDSLNHYMFCLSLNWIHLNRKELGARGGVKNVDLIRKKAFEASISELHTLSKQIKKRPEDLDDTALIGIMSTLDVFNDLSRGNKDVRKALQRLDEHLSKGDVETHSQRVVKRQCVSWLKPGLKIRSEIINCAPSFPVEHLHAVQQSSFVYEIQQQVASMSNKKLIELVRDIRETGFTDQRASYQLILAGITILAFPPIESRESPEAVELSSLFTTLANSLPGFTSIEPFCLATECIDLLLRTHPKCASQWNIDNLMGAIAVITAHSGPQIPREYAGAVYSRLCRLLGTLFGLYRKKLSGRFHLILPPLQRLLRCLFTRNSRVTKSSPIQSELPAWIGSIDDTPLSAAHAGQFCRLLTSLCDPTVSAVQLQRGSQTNQGLSDSTKKVKSLAGQYLQYLIMEYANSQLRGHLSPEIKAALMPGLYSVLDVMSRTTMRAMNAAMESSSRVIFKGLYDDYIRFGKWNHD